MGYNLGAFISLPHPYGEFYIFFKDSFDATYFSFLYQSRMLLSQVLSNLQCTLRSTCLGYCCRNTENEHSDSTSRRSPEGSGQTPMTSFELVKRTARELHVFRPELQRVFDWSLVWPETWLPPPPQCSAFRMKNYFVNLLLLRSNKTQYMLSRSAEAWNNNSINESGWLSIDWWPYLQKKMSGCGGKHFINHF